jgi:hypothetical protein
VPAFSGVRNGPGASVLTVILALVSSTARPGAGHGQDAPIPAARMGWRPHGRPARCHVGPQRGGAELVQGAAGPYAGAGHQHVEPAPTGYDPAGQACDGTLAGDIAGLTPDHDPGPGRQPAASAQRAADRSAGTMPEPAWASAVAIARPRSAEPPVITAT